MKTPHVTPIVPITGLVILAVIGWVAFYAQRWEARFWHSTATFWEGSCSFWKKEYKDYGVWNRPQENGSFSWMQVIAAQRGTPKFVIIGTDETTVLIRKSVIATNNFEIYPLQ